MKESSNLIYYYPVSKGAPSSVGRSIFEHLLKIRDELPVDDISIFCSSNNELCIKNKFQDVNIYTEKNMRNISNGIIHIPISPHLFPNNKFLLHMYAKLKRFPLILNYHGDIRTELSFNYKNNRTLNYSYIPTYVFLPTLLRSSDQLIVHSYLFKDLVEDKYGVKNAKVIPNAVEDFWHSEEYSLIPNKEGFVEIFYHGRLSAEKGVDVLIKGFHKFMVTSNEQKAILYIAGEGPQKEYLANLVAELKLAQNVILLGNLDKYIIKGYLKKVDVAIYPSLWDNFPLSYIEAFACANCPVYFSKKAGIYDFVMMDKNRMYSFEPNIDIICDIIKNVSTGNYDERVITDQKKFARKYRWDNVVNEYIDAYSQFLP
ncbi:glycosyltransferase family 4 protein [Methanolobus psychrotolerans]|uniref:glycosyltransferase family 4 protein n=1 Tax=Methanolobus psychrotolerans TaxID=1874706 RepID=UPI000B916E73|nr:glycosyltransferase family 4 protein [Methanolobus psychrotolerans]